jgi:hypothetical protein
MKIKLEKKNDTKFLLLLGEETNVTGFYLTKEDLLKLKSNIDELLEYDNLSAGDDL